jgi:hypothetical protein
LRDCIGGVYIIEKVKENFKMRAANLRGKQEGIEDGGTASDEST